jgi:hypothetical protein
VSAVGYVTSCTLSQLPMSWCFFVERCCCTLCCLLLSGAICAFTYWLVHLSAAGMHEVAGQILFWFATYRAFRKLRDPMHTL